MNIIKILIVALVLNLSVIVIPTASQADNQMVTIPDNQVVNDEGYGNSDVEYNNSEDDQVNDEEMPLTQENSTNSSADINAQ